MIQLVITYILVGGAFGKVAWSLWHTIKSKDGRSGCSSGCGGCSATNDLKNAMITKKFETPGNFNITKMA